MNVRARAQCKTKRNSHTNTARSRHKDRLAHARSKTKTEAGTGTRKERQRNELNRKCDQHLLPALLPQYMTPQFIHILEFQAIAQHSPIELFQAYAQSERIHSSHIRKFALCPLCMCANCEHLFIQIALSQQCLDLREEREKWHTFSVRTASIFPSRLHYPSSAFFYERERKVQGTTFSLRLWSRVKRTRCFCLQSHSTNKFSHFCIHGLDSGAHDD